MLAMRFSRPFRNANRCASVNTRLGLTSSAMEEYIRKQNLKAELDFLLDLYQNYLPTGKNDKEIKEYFSRLEELIFTTDGNVERESFPDDADSRDRDYKYYSVDQFKQLASGHLHLPSEQNMGHPESKSQDLHDESHHATISSNLEHVQEYPERSSTHHTDIDDHDFPGKLDARDASQLSDIPTDCRGDQCEL